MSFIEYMNVILCGKVIYRIKNEIDSHYDYSLYRKVYYEVFNVQRMSWYNPWWKTVVSSKSEKDARLFMLRRMEKFYDTKSSEDVEELIKTLGK